MMQWATEQEHAEAAIISKARQISKATWGADKREALPDDLQKLLAGLDGALARLDAIRR